MTSVIMKMKPTKNQTPTIQVSPASRTDSPLKSGKAEGSALGDIPENELGTLS